MSTFVDCPSCGRQMQVSDELSGSPLRCPACDSTFDPPPAANGEAKPKLGTPWSMTPNAPREAPALPDAADVGGDESHTNEGDEDERPWEQSHREEATRRDCEPHRGTLVLILGICSLVLPVPLLGLILGIVTILMGRTDLKKMDTGAMDSQGKGTTLAGWICGIIGTIFQALYLLYVIFIIVVYVIIILALIRTIPPPAPAPQIAPPPPEKMGRLEVPRSATVALRDYLPRTRGRYCSGANVSHTSPKRKRGRPSLTLRAGEVVSRRGNMQPLRGKELFRQPQLERNFQARFELV